MKFSLCILLFIISINFAKAAKTVEKCESCDKLVKSLIKNLEKTAKGNFGGGNTDWEDRKLGNYLTSETRFEEILENICDDSDCHSALEEHEDYLFDWFKNKQNKIKSELYSHFCIKTLKSCCPSDTFGSNCASCPKHLNKTCSENGKCDGDGTRKGTGKCLCDSGYNGDFCESCKTGYFALTQDDNTVKCTECHRACKSTCIKDGPDGCVDCKDGWLFNDGRCEDIDECNNGAAKCQDNEYCLNNEGSHNCLQCSNACKSCTGYGADKCVECNTGYEKDSSNNECVDINECEKNPNVCGLSECENTIGSYNCKAKTEQNEATKEEEKENSSMNNDSIKTEL